MTIKQRKGGGHTNKGQLMIGNGVSFFPIRSYRVENYTQDYLSF